ncbi:hypothetical protein IC575_019757 [Cucumis melo]
MLWPRHLVIPLDEKMKNVYQADPRLPSLTLNTKRAPVTLRLLLWELDYIGSKIQIHVPAKVFGHLYKVMEENGTLGSYKFADAGSVLVGISKEDRAQILNARLLGTDHRQILMFPYNSGNHWCLIAIDFSRGTAYWMDPLRNRINNDASDVVWMYCPKQGGIVECGYYVMQFMRDIILSSNRTIIEVESCLHVFWISVHSCVDYSAVMVVIDKHRCLWNGGGKSMFKFINDIGSGEQDGRSAKFMFKLNFDFRRGEEWGGGRYLYV